ncbi:hypothetical protein PoMZ_12185 [Pyricularia oryzae]|uniref:Uncharacterized protein n=1 Tax=Pyricularia oryzae TaxID=318829 RepID=A0A4V1C7G3_PYROR|nr:hypothetical protein PoMZ_12185 [Pyricularia oryzae]
MFDAGVLAQDLGRGYRPALQRHDSETQPVMACLASSSTLNATVDVAEIVKPKAHPEVAHRLDAVGPGQVEQVPEVVHRGVVHHELQRFGLWPLLPAHLV